YGGTVPAAGLVAVTVPAAAVAQSNELVRAPTSRPAAWTSEVALVVVSPITFGTSTAHTTTPTAEPSGTGWSKAGVVPTTCPSSVAGLQLVVVVCAPANRS